MKIEQIDRYYAPNAGACSIFTFVPNISHYGDVLYGGCENGHLFYVIIQSNHIREFTLSSNYHRGPVSSICVTQVSNNKIEDKFSSTSLGIVFSGGRDHSIRVWNPCHGSKPLIQTLVGHQGIITAIVEGRDGSILSISSDGLLKVWISVEGRDDFLNPFYECVYIFKSPGNWLTCLSIRSIGIWTCYASDSIGCIHLFHKNSIYQSNQFSQYNLQRFNKWEKVHDLSIISMILINDEDILATTSSDGCCKLTDSKSGQCLQSIHNNRSARYEDLVWISIENRLYLTDELGYVEIFSIQKMCIISTIHLMKQTTTERACTLASHKFQILTKICKAKDDYHFFLLLPSSSGIHSKTGAYSGEIALWRLQVGHSILHFQGHSDSVIHVSTLARSNRNLLSTNNTSSYSIENSSSSSSSSSSVTTTKKGVKTSSRLSQEESCVISIGADNTIRCWDEFDSEERYRIKVKSGSEIMTSIVVWNVNSIITCHEDGTICIWNMDSGNMIDTKILKDSVQAVAEGTNHYCYGLYVADISGKVAFINLASFKKNPMYLPIDFCHQGYHDNENPGILSMAYHLKSNTCFSGGHDRTIRYWKPLSNKPQVLYGHDDAVCCIQVSDDFLLSGDEDGKLILWMITSNINNTTVIDGDKVNYHIKLTKLCYWPTKELSSTRALCKLYQSNDYTLYVLQAGLIGKIIIWEISIKPTTSIVERKSGSGIELSEDYECISYSIIKHGMENNVLNDNVNDILKEQSIPLNRHVAREAYSMDDDYMIVIGHPIDISILKYVEIPLENVEISSIQLITSSVDDHSSKNFVPQYVYCGTTDGPVLRYSVDHYRQ